MIPFLYIGLFIATEQKGTDPSPSSDEKRWWKEYRILDIAVITRENLILVSGSIFVTASLVLLGQSANPSIVEPLDVATTLREVAVFHELFHVFHMAVSPTIPFRQIERAAFKRLKGIEGQLGIEAHLYMAIQRDPIRRWVWLWVLNGFSLQDF